VHLDELVNDPPAPGTTSWLAIVHEVVEFLAAHDGSWIVALPLGDCDVPPAALATREDAFALARRADLREPPGVHRLVDPSPPRTWEGDHRRWELAVNDGIVESVSVSRSSIEEQAGDPWYVRLHFEIRR
jgi:hypothetical protein